MLADPSAAIWLVVKVEIAVVKLIGATWKRVTHVTSFRLPRSCAAQARFNIGHRVAVIQTINFV
jgi:hypothetical protein